MFCPKCSQQHSSSTARFCSRCGFELSGVQLLITGREPSNAPDSSSARRKKDQTKGAFLMFVSAFIVAAITVDMPPSHSARIFFLVVAWLLITLFINLGPLVRYFFGENVLAADRGRSLMSRVSTLVRRLGKTQQEGISLPRQRTPIGISGDQDLNTGELVRTPSVTEHTTNLLTKQ